MKKGTEDVNRPRTSEELILLQSYLSLIGIWFALPSVTLVIIKDHRRYTALALLALVTSFLITAYILQWDVLFPRSSSLVVGGID